MLCHFKNIDSIIQTNLLYTYCSSFYGSVLWNLNNDLLDKFDITWRAALKPICHLPYNTHRYVLCAIAGKWSVFDELCRVSFHFISKEVRHCPLGCGKLS
jgi:hypothetical protein